MVAKSRKSERKKMRYWTCYETDLTYDEALEILRKKIGHWRGRRFVPAVFGDVTEKGLIQLYFPERISVNTDEGTIPVFPRGAYGMVQISPKGKVTIYYNSPSPTEDGEKIEKNVRGLLERLCSRKIKFVLRKRDLIMEKDYEELEEHYASLAADYEVSLSLDAEAGEKQK